MKHDPVADTYLCLREAGNPLKGLPLRGRLLKVGSNVIVHTFRHARHTEFKDAKVTDIKGGKVELHMPHGEMSLEFDGHGEAVEGIYKVLKQWSMASELDEIDTVALEMAI
jgi:hypothetical protein